MPTAFLPFRRRGSYNSGARAVLWVYAKIVADAAHVVASQPKAGAAISTPGLLGDCFPRLRGGRLCVRLLAMTFCPSWPATSLSYTGSWGAEEFG